MRQSSLLYQKCLLFDFSLSLVFNYFYISYLSNGDNLMQWWLLLIGKFFKSFFFLCRTHQIPTPISPPRLRARNQEASAGNGDSTSAAARLEVWKVSSRWSRHRRVEISLIISTRPDQSLVQWCWRPCTVWLDRDPTYCWNRWQPFRLSRRRRGCQRKK